MTGPELGQFAVGVLAAAAVASLVSRQGVLAWPRTWVAMRLMRAPMTRAHRVDELSGLAHHLLAGAPVEGAPKLRYWRPWVVSGPLTCGVCAAGVPSAVASWLLHDGVAVTWGLTGIVGRLALAGATWVLASLVAVRIPG